MIKKEELIQKPINLRPHVVLLGAGASKASFPTGDLNGRKLPTMSDFVSILNLSYLLMNAGVDQNKNFEEIYAALNSNLQKSLEKRIYEYFTSMELPPIATHYDRLLLSLRKKDAIFTFNWDPFLFDAYIRNLEVAPLPGIYFLHGNVRIGFCENDDTWGRNYELCQSCNKQFTEIPLLYPIKQKNYSTSNKYIAQAWSAAKDLFAEAFTITIFGYSAPISDTDAFELLKNAWLASSERKIEHLEIIDIEGTETLFQRWREFAPTLHINCNDFFNSSHLWRWPRRSCESWIYPMKDGAVCEDFPLPSTDCLLSLQEYIKQIAIYET